MSVIQKFRRAWCRKVVGHDMRIWGDDRLRCSRCRYDYTAEVERVRG